MSRYAAGPVMAGLKDFQRATVAHVIDRYFGPDPTRRFLVADETGLGKSVVARGVIAQILERLQDDDSIARVDVIYVCSNQDVARQNISRLRVTPDETITVSSRLTLLAKEAAQLNAAGRAKRKRINLVAFTPGTSFDQGWRTGTAEERALLYLLLERASNWDGWRERSAVRALQGTVSTPERFRQQCDRLRDTLGDKLDPTICKEFLRRARDGRLIQRFNGLLDDIGRKEVLPPELRERARSLIGDLRTALATAGVEVLEPDLIILDEFQRFRELLDPNGGEGAELARQLFDYRAARVLLLSATPYKPFTFAEEAATGEDHYADFRQVLRFLCDDEVWHVDVTKTFDAYREALMHGEPCADLLDSLRTLLLRVMCRTERPVLGPDGMLREHVTPAEDLDAGDLRSYVAMRRIAAEVDAPMTVEYWKSAPYFLNFVDGYQLGEKIRTAHVSLDDVQLLDAEAIGRGEPIELGNARLRRFAADTLDHGWWRLLWLPPSLPYHTLGEPFASAASEGITKRLLFSSWNATPTAVAGLLSYEAERRITQASGQTDDIHRRITRLDYRMENDRPAAMSTLAIFWPHPGLAEVCDPLAAARQHPDEIVPLEQLERRLRDRLTGLLPLEFIDPSHAGKAEAWQAVFRWPGANLNVYDEDTTTGLDRHVEHARQISTAIQPVAQDPAEVLDDLVAIGLHGPGNVAWRALRRLVRPDSLVTPQGLWRTAFALAQGLRSLFNRSESAQLLDGLLKDTVYWQAVLRYCAAGGLQAVFDEYLHTLRSAESDTPLDDESLAELADQAREAIASRPSTYVAFDPRHPAEPIRLPGRFALRYGASRGEEQAQVDRKMVVRRAFNSPFWPFIVATTSAGQEGIDFHHYCSAVVHWNTPANPVDFEQREGRVHRFGGHAVRRNVAHAHRADALRSAEPDVWKAAYDAARRHSERGDFSPYWVFAGPAKIERHLLPYPLSRDSVKFERLKADLAIYRLAFGQPRQEDLLALIRRQNADHAPTAEVLDLRPDPEGIRREQ